MSFIPPEPYTLEINTIVVEFELVRHRRYAGSKLASTVIRRMTQENRGEISDGCGLFRGRKSNKHQQCIQQVRGKE